MSVVHWLVPKFGFVRQIKTFDSGLDRMWGYAPVYTKFVFLSPLPWSIFDVKVYTKKKGEIQKKLILLLLSIIYEGWVYINTKNPMYIRSFGTTVYEDVRVRNVYTPLVGVKKVISGLYPYMCQYEVSEKENINLPFLYSNKG